MDESDGLENRCGRKATVGSNPTSSAIDTFTRLSLVARERYESEPTSTRVSREGESNGYDVYAPTS